MAERDARIREREDDLLEAAKHKPVSDASNAEVFREMWADVVRYDHARRRWLAHLHRDVEDCRRADGNGHGRGAVHCWNRRVLRVSGCGRELRRQGAASVRGGRRAARVPGHRQRCVRQRGDWLQRNDDTVL